MKGLTSFIKEMDVNPLDFGKEIRRFKIAINTACPLRCEYCFIDKDSGEIVSWRAVQESVRMLLASPGVIKKLLIYGGEPFLKFDLVKEISLYARNEARKAKKELDLSICTSGAVPFKKEQLQFLRDQKFFVSVSMDGDQSTHDRRRVLKNGNGSWQKAAQNLPALFELIGKRRSMAIQCVHPDNVERLLDNFKTLISLGFENVEIEVIHGFGWQEKNKFFRPMMQKVLAWILDEALDGKMRFLVCSLVPLMLKDGVLLEDMCPFHSSMECYPDGSYSFYPFAFVDWEGRRRSAMGNVSVGVMERYRGCRFDPESSQCRHCTSDYYQNPSVNEGNDCYHWRTEMARDFMARMALRSQSDEKYRAYLKEALIRCRIS